MLKPFDSEIQKAMNATRTADNMTMQNMETIVDWIQDLEEEETMIAETEYLQ
jgi:hypothetical protein